MSSGRTPNISPIVPSVSPARTVYGLIFAGRLGLTGAVGDDGCAEKSVSRGTDGAAGRTIREGGADGGIVLSLNPVCASASPPPATTKVAAMTSLEKVELNRRACTI